MSQLSFELDDFAEEEFYSIVDYYKQFDPSLATDFIQECDRATKRLRQFPNAGSPYFGYKDHMGVDMGSKLTRTLHLRKPLLSGDEGAIFGDKVCPFQDLKIQCRGKGVYYGILDKTYPLGTKSVSMALFLGRETRNSCKKLQMNQLF